jgi:electron transfer flavoprotein alpha subunit
MNGVLVVAEARRGALRDVTFELVGAGRELAAAAGVELVVAAIGAEAESLAGELAAEGVDAVVSVATPTEHFEPHLWQQALEALIEARQPALVLAGHTIDSLGFAPAVAARRRLGFATDVTAISWSDGLRAWRGAYGEKLREEIEFEGKDCTLLTLRPGTFPPAPRNDRDIPVAALDVDYAATPRVEHLGYREEEAADVDITKARFLLAIGRGVEDEEDVARFEQLAERLGAVLGVSRPLVDAGWVPSSRQVGQSGKTVKPAVYLALGISGAVQHLAGMREAETIIAVNSDPEAPIFGVAQYGAVADLFEIADELERASG